MTEYHTEYKRAEGESTQWEDIHRKLGNFAPAEAVWKPEPFSPAQEAVKDRAWLDSKQEPTDLDQAEVDFADDRYLEAYRCDVDQQACRTRAALRCVAWQPLVACRQQRLKELQQQAAQRRFGEVRSITKEQFVEEVTKASESTWVIVLLYKDK